jgi:3-oxoacyl-[acyl-carrier protein] reductase
MLEQHGRLDILVNNAAVSLQRPFFEIDVAEWDEVMAVNLRGTFFGCQIAGRIMRNQGSGRIVNLSSLAGQAGSIVNGAHYSASKGAVLALTKVVARELAPHGVTVNAVAPAAIAGPVMAALPPGQVESLERSIPVGRLGTAEEVAALVSFLASDEAAFVTGATFDVNGGLLMR